MSQAHYSFPSFSYPEHLLSTEQLTADDALRLVHKAQRFIELNRKQDKKAPDLRGRTLINLFYENSTRTRTSFELAGKRLGMDVINISASASSVNKGETLIDTAQTLGAMQPDAIVIRHPRSGAAELLASQVSCHVINGGDGTHQHPTQALLDLLTIIRHKKSAEGLIVAICGDIKHSRVARSHAALLPKLGATLRLIAPPQLLPIGVKQWDCEVVMNLEAGIKQADVIIMLRLQQERMDSALIPSVREYFHLFGLNHKKLEHAKPDVLVMHPGPINRGVEIESVLADDLERSIILEQVELGVAMRQAILMDMLEEEKE